MSRTGNLTLAYSADRGTSGAATYAYDSSNRITGATVPSGASASGISYDSKGNLLTLTYAAGGLANLTTFAAAYSATYSQVATVNVAPFESSPNLETYEYGTTGELLTDVRPGNLSGICPECGTRLTEAQRVLLAQGGRKDAALGPAVRAGAMQPPTLSNAGSAPGLHQPSNDGHE